MIQISAEELSGSGGKYRYRLFSSRGQMMSNGNTEPTDETEQCWLEDKDSADEEVFYPLFRTRSLFSQR